MAKMKYSEMPRDVSSDSVAALRLAQGSPDQDRWSIYSGFHDEVSPVSSWVQSPSYRIYQPVVRRPSSGFRSHCLGRKESPEPDGSTDDLYIHTRTSPTRYQQQSNTISGASPSSYVLHHSLPRSSAIKSSSLPSNARSGLSAMLCMDSSTLDRSQSPVIMHILQINPENIAAQLTLIDMPVFKSIQPEELSSCAWTKKNKLDVAPNVVAMTRRFNHVIFWTVQEILNERMVRQRAEVLAHFIRIAKKLHEINNLHSLFAILSALRSAAVYRLQKTWNALSKKDIQLFDKLTELFSDNNNWEKLRQHMDTLKLPCVPYLGLFLTDLIYIDMAHPHHGGLESQQRQLKMNNILRIVSSYQQSDYSFLPIKKHIMEYLRSARYIEELQKLVEDDQFKLSMKLEPQTPTQSSSSSKESFNEAMNKLQVSPRKSPSKSALETTTNGTFVMGHRKTRSLGTKLRSASLPRSAYRQQFTSSAAVTNDPYIFRNGPQHLPTHPKSDPGSRNSVGSITNQGFDPTQRHLIDDSVLEEHVPCPHHNQAGDKSVPSGKGSTHSLSGLDSPLPPPPVRCCCIQGCIRKKAILKDGRRPAVTAWQRFWIQLSGPHLVFYAPKSLRGSDRSDFRREPCKVVCITGWNVKQHDSPRHPDSIQLSNPFKGHTYKLRIASANATKDWLFYLSMATHTRMDDSDPGNLMSFE